MCGNLEGQAHANLWPLSLHLAYAYRTLNLHFVWHFSLDKLTHLNMCGRFEGQDHTLLNVI